MKKTFENRIMQEGIVDTKSYRYALTEYPDRLEIQRIPLEYLDTTSAIDGWETVKVIEQW